MKVSEFNYELPENLIAQVPIEKRDESRLMVLNKEKQTIEHKIFRDIIEAVKLKYGLEYKRLNAEEKKKYNKTDSKWYVYRKE